MSDRSCDCHEATSEGPRVIRTRAFKAGSCNFCDRHSNPNTGLIDHDVFEVSRKSGGGLKVRFCVQCAKELGLTGV